MVTAVDIIDRLTARYDSREWVRCCELREKPGFQACRTIDFAAVHKWPGKKHRFVAVEVKIDRADWLRELDDPTKRQPWIEAAHEFWFACDKGVVKEGEVPSDCGLLEVWGDKLRKMKQAPFRAAAQGPTPGMWLMMLRSVQDRGDENERKLREFAEFAGRSIGIDDLRRLAGKWSLRNEWQLRQEIQWRLQEDRRKSGKETGRWAYWQRKWEWKLRQAFGSSTPETIEKAIDLLDCVGVLRDRVASLHEVLVALDGGKAAAGESA